MLIVINLYKILKYLGNIFKNYNVLYNMELQRMLPGLKLKYLPNII